ncbi:von Hippel-Lindau-like protein [Manduca sexta]|uniref:von Hippel-Lindau-like protein n=1 Tax=Manduca sexta TaxID=7130 RepID=UPI00188ECFDC|nr:von Hippel-Lindau-like protein [Manduca sexta]
MAFGDRNLLYEENEKGERVVVKSIDSTRRAYVRFTNCTSQRISVVWRDFQGLRRDYILLNPGKHFDVDTYITHPWEFTDYKTQESYVVNNKTVFRAPPSIANVRHRFNWNITVPLRTLRYTTLLSIASILRDEDAADELQLPRDLATDLRALTAQLLGPPETKQAD